MEHNITVAPILTPFVESQIFTTNFSTSTSKLSLLSLPDNGSVTNLLTAESDFFTPNNFSIQETALFNVSSKFTMEVIFSSGGLFLYHSPQFKVLKKITSQLSRKLGFLQFNFNFLIHSVLELQKHTQ